MILATENKQVELVFKTRKIVKITNLLKGNNFETLYFNAMNKLDLDNLSKIIMIFAEDTEGKDIFSSSAEVYDFIDEYKKENNKSYYDIFKEIAEAINDEGFFITKMTQEELEKKVSNPLQDIDLNKLLEPAVERSIAKIIEKEMEEQSVEEKEKKVIEK